MYFHLQIKDFFSQGRQGRKFGVTQVEEAAAVLNFVIESKAVKVAKFFILFKVHTSVLESDAIEKE